MGWLALKSGEAAQSRRGWSRWSRPIGRWRPGMGWKMAALAVHQRNRLVRSEALGAQGTTLPARHTRRAVPGPAAPAKSVSIVILIGVWPRDLVQALP